MDNLEEIDWFLEKFNLLRLNQKEIVTINKHGDWSCDQKSSKNKCPGPDGFTEEFYQTFRKELMPILLKLFQKIAEEWRLPNSFYKATITLDTKTRQRQPKERKIQINITDEHRCKNPQQNFSKQNSATHQKAHTPWSSDLFQGWKDSSIHSNQSMWYTILTNWKI